MLVFLLLMIGCSSDISHIVGLIKQHKCKTILDLGIGLGNIGEAIRRAMPKSRIYGIEIWERYENSKWDSYDKVWIDDFRIFSIEPIYDAIIASHVIEHLTKDVGLAQLQRLKRLAQKIFIIALPFDKVLIDKIPTTDGNIFNRHQSLWKEKEILELDFKLVRRTKTAGLFKVLKVFYNSDIPDWLRR